MSQNRRSRTAGIDGKTRSYVEQQLDVARLLEELRDEVKTGRFRALSVRERMIPKRDGRMRRLEIRALRDRVMQMALKLVIEPIFESGFASSYGYRPGRRAQDAIAEIVHFTGVHANYGVSSRFGGEPGPRSDGVRRPEDPWPASRPRPTPQLPSPRA